MKAPIKISWTHRCQPSRIRRDSPAFSSDVPRPAKWDKCPAFLENYIIIFFVADYFTFFPCNATKWRSSIKARSILCTPTDAVYISRLAAVINHCCPPAASTLLVTCHIGLYRENAIAIESEARDPFGGNVYFVTMQITFPIPEFARKERNLHCDVVHVTTKWVSRLVLDHAIAAIQTSR